MMIVLPETDLLSRRRVMTGLATAFGSGALAGCAGPSPFSTGFSSSSTGPSIAALAEEKIAILPPADRIIVFHEVVGRITDTKGQFICDARSGKDGYRNKKGACTRQDKNQAAIPPGWWAIGDKRYSEVAKRYVLDLSPVGRTDACGRNGLCLHEMFFKDRIWRDDENTAGCVGVGHEAMPTLFAWRARNQIAQLHVV